MQEPFIPVGGTPILPPSYLTVYFLFFLIFLSVLYVYFYHKKQPTLLWQKVRLLLFIAIVLKVTLIAGGTLLAAYWLIPTPSVRRTLPASQTNTFSPTSKIEIVFDRPVKRALVEKSISPETPGRWVFENSIYTTHLYRNLVFYPTYSLRPNTKYTIKLSNIRNLLNISPPYEYQFDFTTQPSPKILSVSPVSGKHDIDINAKIKVTLDNPNANISEFNFEFTPPIEYDLTLDSSKTIYTLIPKTPLLEGKEYKLKIQKSDIILNLEDQTVIERDPSTLEYAGNFTTLHSSSKLKVTPQPLSATSPAKVLNITPENKLSAVSIHSPIKITFDQNIEPELVEQTFSISPQTVGSFDWDENTLIFTPQKPLLFTTNYKITLANTFTSEFTTQDATTKLAVPAYLQKYTLSCEIASLRMALNFRGLNVTEDDLIPQVGTDTTPHTGNVWGNPYAAFVGNIRGTQMADGYGVYWGPIAKAAKNYRTAQDFQNWNIHQLTTEISKGNPVIVWIYSHFGTKTSWTTPDGTSIFAVRDEHAVVVVGFVGPVDNPTQIIVNDPLSGQVYWSRSSFDKKWSIFENSGVVVY